MSKGRKKQLILKNKTKKERKNSHKYQFKICCISKNHFGPEKLIPAPDLKQCVFCNRSYALGRIAKHEVFCKKTSHSNKCFNDDPDAGEGLVKEASVDDCHYPLHVKFPPGLYTNWRQKRQDFLKQIQEIKASMNGKNECGNDLPFPPPQCDSTDYVQCQHCSRRFNQKSAERHISICATRAKARD